MHQVTVGQALFEEFQRLIYGETGIWLGHSKTSLLCGRLFRRLHALQIPTLAEYYLLVSDPKQHQERMLMIDAITTNETRFFREPQHFEWLTHKIFPRWQAEAHRGTRAKKLRLWSAGCSSGEEPYSLAMLLAQQLPATEGWDARVLGTDISTRMLEQAVEGIYPMDRAADIPNTFLQQYMRRGIATQNGRMKVAPEVRGIVQFSRLNLSRFPYPIEGPLDLIFCRNVLIYFDADSKRRAVENLARCISAEGLLFTGHTENLNGVTSLLRNLAPTIYCKTESYSRLKSNFQDARH
ncbi:MAG TPA: CheR family methyltransferase [Candidatus Saccharimonadales bacterium]|jgi:chemotaxis protein methyltransferase CheR|nr:CheR family methyltransferase [Candidatus Saccharimonadales bacterium]